jgi:hypothetical protein
VNTSLSSPPPDNDECVLGGGNTCSPNADCADNQGSYTCACKAGYDGSSDGRTCVGERRCSCHTPVVGDQPLASPRGLGLRCRQWREN